MATINDDRIEKIRDEIEETTLGLETGDLKLIYGALFEVRAKWRPIGLELGLTPGTLDAIEQMKINPSDRLEAVLLDWLRGATAATWEQLIDALRSVLVGANQLAEKLELEHSFPETVPSEKRKRKHSGEDDKQQLTSDIKTIERKYIRLQTATRESLKKCNVELMSLVALLTSYRTSRAVIKSESNMLLLDQQENLKRADSVDEIFVIVSPFWSFLDFEILEDVIESYGADSDRHNLATYVTELKEFLNTWKAKPCKISRLDDGKTRMKLCFKLDTDSLAIYRDLKAAIARIFEIQVYALHLHSIEPGCIQLIFFCLEIVPIMALRSDQIAQLSQIIPSVLKVSLIHGSTSEVLFEREDRSPSPAHSKPVPPPKIRQEYTEEKGEKTIQESHEKKWYQRLFSWRTSQRAGEEAEPKTTPSPGETVEPTVTRVTKESSESSTRGKRWYQRLFSRHSSRQEQMNIPEMGEEEDEQYEQYEQYEIEEHPDYESHHPDYESPVQSSPYWSSPQRNSPTFSFSSEQSNPPNPAQDTWSSPQLSSSTFSVLPQSIGIPDDIEIYSALTQRDQP
ncbi:uncharacterized protein LOC135334572 isoform X3 [Halichondria panicea]|uniref:uncharacterized protein LOC135334572 isoform X3 n=1 Tax=Halichondria panicea TaxID=6063 RepID=UPI00312B2E7A